PDSHWLASGSADQTVRLWHRATGRAGRVFHEHTGTISGLAFTPDGRRLCASGSWHRGMQDSEGQVVVWDVATGQVRFHVKALPDVVRVLALTPDGGTLALGDDAGRVRLWDAATGREEAAFAAHGAPVSALAVSPDGTALATGSEDTTAKVWDLATRRERATL